LPDSVSKKRAARKRKAPAKKSARSRAPAQAAEMRYALGGLIDSEASLAEATAGLLALDPQIVARLIEIGGPPPLRRREPGFAGLAAIIVSQQVSVASASAIFKRLETRLAPLEARTVSEATDEALRECGLSTAKVRALRALAKAIVEDGLDLATLGSLEAAEAHRELIAVKGVGPWTADIFLLFCLGHPDAFPHGDLALQEAARLALELETRPDGKALARIAERWRPWRGVAARMLWAYYRQIKQRSGMALANASG
jgi:DNA-3-methyladenine glycosylase II